MAKPRVTSRAPRHKHPDAMNPMKAQKQADQKTHGQCHAKVDELEEKLDAAVRTLHDLKAHITSKPIDAFAHPDKVADLLSRAEKLIDGDVPAIVERNRELEAENEQLREATHIAEELLEAKIAAAHDDDTISAEKEREGYEIQELNQMMRKVSDALDGGGGSDD